MTTCLICDNRHPFPHDEACPLCKVTREEAMAAYADTFSGAINDLKIAVNGFVDAVKTAFPWFFK